MELKGKLRGGVTATDLVLTITEMLRREKVVGKFVEFCGEGTASLSVAERATIGNMAPEYGATMGFFPVDERTIDYFRGTGRTEAEIAAFEAYFKAQKMFGVPKAKDINFTKLLTLDLSTVAPSLAGPKRPQDRIEIGNVKNTFIDLFSKPVAENGFNQPADKLGQTYTTSAGTKVKNGDILIAAITSCTNTSNPSVLLAAGWPRGRRSRPDRAKHIKTSLAPDRAWSPNTDQDGPPALPGKAGLRRGRLRLHHLHRQRRRPDPGPERGHHRQRPGLRRRAVGQSQLRGPHPPEHQGQLPGLAAAGRGLCPGRHHHARPDDRTRGPRQARRRVAGRHLAEHRGNRRAAQVRAGSQGLPGQHGQVKSNPGELWEHIKGVTGDTYNWPDSTYIAEPPFFQDFGMTPGATPTVKGARALGVFGDSVTTDHISPAGSIKETSPAGKWLRNTA